MSKIVEKERLQLYTTLYRSIRFAIISLTAMQDYKNVLAGKVQV